MQKRLAVLLLVAAVSALRGVSPDRAGLYAPSSTWACLDGSAKLRWNQINDEFCDCKDASDEPGTSACPDGQFYCHNKGYLALTLPSSRVDDGLCDCCDGSDEVNGCANTCEEMGREWREQQEREKLMRKEGFQKRQELIASGKATRTELTAQAQTLEAAVEQHRAEETARKAVKDEAEAPEKQAKDEFDAVWNAQVEKEEAERNQKIFQSLDRNSDGVINTEDLTQETAFDSDGDGQVSVEEVTALLDQDGDGTLGETEESVSFDGFKEKLLPDLPEALKNLEGASIKPDYTEEIQALISAASAARDEHRKAADTLRASERELNEVKKKLDIDAGPHDEWAAMVHECVELRDREYRYELCLFEKASQESLNGGRATSLGTWKDWTGSPDRHSEMLYGDGERCWNGPSRSARVSVRCGLENKLISVAEPNRCEYAFVLESPAACTAGPHDEL